MPRFEPLARPLIRVAPRPPLATGQTRAGAAKVRLPFVEGVPLAGWGPFLRFGARTADWEDDSRPLHVRALVLEAPSGERVALLTIDLHGGSRYLTEKTAALLADEGFHAGNLWLCGTHNHAGPAGLSASPYFDAFVASTGLFSVGALRVGFNQALADELATRIERAVREAVRTLRPALVGSEHTLRLPGWTRQRSLAPLRANFPGEPDAALIERFRELGGGDGHRDSLERWTVDARVQTIAAFEGERLIGAFGTFAGHCALISRSHFVQSADWFGHAAQHAEARHPGAVVALAAGAVGDVDPLPPELTFKQLQARREDQDLNFADVSAQGRALGEAVLEAVTRARQVRAPLASLSARRLEERIAGARVDDVTVAARARIGIPTLAGSELGTGDVDVGITLHWREGVRTHAPDAGDAQWPKTEDNADDERATPRQRVFAGFAGRVSFRTTRPYLDAQHDKLTVRLVELGLEGRAPVLLLGLPGEPTTWLAQGLASSTGHGGRVLVTGVTGDYCGYLTTAAEYDAQHYEGSSTIWGRHTERWLRRQVLRLAAGEGTALPALEDPGFLVLRERWVTRVEGDQGTLAPF